MIYKQTKQKSKIKRDTVQLNNLIIIQTKTIYEKKKTIINIIKIHIHINLI
jgi:hypothetical protein